MTALPPTLGHGDLIRFASHLSDHAVVVLCTQPTEPLVKARVDALTEFVEGIPGVELKHHHEMVQQEPRDECDVEFWGLWRRILLDLGFQPRDLIVASEYYGERLSQEMGGEFIPYDIDRELNPVQATVIRDNPVANFGFILPEMQPVLRKRVTIFGAESVGKSTLTTIIGKDYTWTPEWARLYLDAVGTEITVEKMYTIWRGQRALHDQAEHRASRMGSAFIVHDTDLFSTLGYWRLSYGSVPPGLVEDARERASDLYVILGQDEVPFHPDPQRYGGDRRESDDSLWIAIAEEYDLPYIYLQGSLDQRIASTKEALTTLFGDPFCGYRREKGMA